MDRIHNLKQRAALLAELRSFFAKRAVLEVQTPVLGTAPNPDPSLVNFTTVYTQPGNMNPKTFYLQTSPEFHMKRLLAEGIGSIYQISPVFRNEEAGRHHNPEFHLLEWYRVGFDYLMLMNEVDELLQQVLGIEPAKRITYQALFLEFVAIEPLTCTIEVLASVIAHHGIQLNSPILSVDEGLQVIMTHILEPKLGEGCVFVYDFPASQAMLAELKPEDNRVAARFELYVNGVELANGFQELRDSNLQRARFEEHNQQRRRMGLPILPLDEKFLSAIPNMPACAGVALGVDRLLQQLCGGVLAENMAFGIDAV